MRGALLGPQQLKQSLGAVVRALGREGPVALITAGWQEREDQDEELAAQLGRSVINLRLYERGEQVLAADPEYARAHRARQDQLRQIQEFYKLRLERTFDAALDIARKAAGTDLEAEEVRLSLEHIRRIDAEHLERVTALREAYELQTRPLLRPVIVRHRAELKKILSSVGVVAIAGGHVAVLLNRLRMFGFHELLTDEHALIAWSGGAMVTSERVILFHESPPEGAGISEVLEAGLGFHRGVVPLPNPKLRLKLDDPLRVGWLSRRYSHSKCVAFDQGDFVLFDGDRFFGAEGTLLLKQDGTVGTGWTS
ncbi:MAG: hypothetical protein JNM17_39195 [Archangium sp.]|nr:hypothetical protein [Archangium sp.]